MKRIVIILFILTANGFTLAWADDLAMADTIAETTTHSIQGGTVKSVSWSDSTKNSKSEMVVLDSKKKPINIYVTSTTTLWDSDAKAIMTDKILAKVHINVIYLTTPEGINIAKSIKVLK